MALVPLNWDILLEHESLLANSTFDIDALNQTMEKLAITNYWQLYQVQRTKVGVERFDIPFSEFVLETRLPGQYGKKIQYPKRYVHYVNYTFIETTMRERYRRSDLYLKELKQETIASHPELFRKNFLLFVGGDLITSCEVYPYEDRLCFVIDVATRNHPDGIDLETYRTYRETNPMVSVFIVPNYTVKTFSTTVNTIKAYSNRVPLAKISTVDKLTSNSLFFTNLTTEIYGVKLLNQTYYDPETEEVVFPDLSIISSDVSRIQVWCFDFPKLTIYDVNSDEPYLENLEGFPIPTENMTLFTFDPTTGVTNYDASLTVDKFYPNIYRFNNGPTETMYTIFAWYDEINTYETEKYEDDLKFYRQYVDLYEEYRTGTIKELLANYVPTRFQYSEWEYLDSIYVPHIINYKVAKLREFIETYPKALETYWRILGVPSEKYYLDMTKFNLKSRIRKDSSQEDVSLEADVTFAEERYVFLMRREFALSKDYDFRIWVDGILLNESQYRILSGLDFYYIYIPTTLITTKSLIEIERYRYYVDKNVGHAYGEANMISFTPKEDSIVQAQDIYVYDLETLQYLTKDQYKLYHKVDYTNQLLEIPVNASYIVSGEEIFIAVTDPDIIGKDVGYGVHQASYLHTGEAFDSEGENPDLLGNPYTRMDVPNFGNYSETSYRMFNKGRLCVPAQFYVQQATTYGSMDSVITKCVLKDGDQFTLDHVPGSYRVVFFKEEVEENGYVDLDGYIPLPLSFKWYDIYLNGVRLNRNMVDFVSETKCYIHDVKSRRNLLIMERNHDDDVFYLTSFAYKKPGYSKSIMDDLVNLCKDVKEEFDKHYPIIDDTDPDILEGGVMAQDSLINTIIFMEYLYNAHLDSNIPDPEVLARVKTDYPDNYSGGRYHISGNENPEAKIIKRIDCNALFQ